MSRGGPDLSAGDYAFLGFVGRGVDTAYQIKKAMAGSISHFWNAAHSQVYSQATRLARDGFVREREETDGRRRKVLSLTPKGRTTLRRWLGEPAGIAELRDEMLVKVFFAAEGDPATVRKVLEQQREKYRDGLTEYQQLHEQLGKADGPMWEHARLTLELGIAVHTAYLAWLDSAIPRI